jgi:integrase
MGPLTAARREHRLRRRPHGPLRGEGNDCGAGALVESGRRRACVPDADRGPVAQRIEQRFPKPATRDFLSGSRPSCSRSAAVWTFGKSPTVTRRANHEGSVYQRTDGQWVASIQVSGKRLYKYGKSRSEASKKLQAILREHHQGTLTHPSRTTLDEWVSQWLDEAKLRPSSQDTYRQVLAPIRKEIGSIRLDKLTAMVLSLTFTKLSQAGLGARRLQLGHGYLKSCLGRAVDLELIGRNPMARVKRPEWMPKPRVYWTPEQTVRFLETCTESRLKWAPLFTVLVTSGLRVSETLGLCGSDLDLHGRKLNVRRAMVWSAGEYTGGPVKSRAAVRSLSLMAAGVGG